MKSSNQSIIKQAFTQQASEFESSGLNFSKKEYLDYAVSKIAPCPTDNVLEVAAGTCACGRAIAPFAKQVICLDMTSAMLSIGKMSAERERRNNMTFVLGDAMELPFLDNSFTVVLSRLAFHHFPEIEPPFLEMVRVLKSGGKLILIDMEATEEPWREHMDNVQRLRDPSHVRMLSKADMMALYEKYGLNVTCCESVPMPTNLQNWLDHTETPTEIRKKIVSELQRELDGGEKTGFAPYYRGDEIWFDHKWTLVVGEKR